MNNHSFGCDFGSYHLKIYNRDADGYLMQHNMVAVQDKNTLLACGDEAYAMYEKAPANIHVGYFSKGTGTEATTFLIYSSASPDDMEEAPTILWAST